MRRRRSSDPLAGRDLWGREEGGEVLGTTPEHGFGVGGKKDVVLAFG